MGYGGQDIKQPEFYVEPNFTLSLPFIYKGDYNEKEAAISRNLLIFFAPVSVELLNLWNDFRKVVRFIDEDPWVKPLLARIQSDKNRGGK